MKCSECLDSIKLLNPFEDEKKDKLIEEAKDAITITNGYALCAKHL